MVDGEACPVFTRRQEKGNCAADACKDTDKVLEDGTCSACPAYERGQGNEQEMCGPDRCDTGQILLPNGQCDQCGLYGHPDDQGKICVSDKCKKR